MSTKESLPGTESKPEDWPITRLHKNQEIFLSEVLNKSLKILKIRYPTDEDLHRIIVQTTQKELARITSDPWKCDPKDDLSFWEGIYDAVQNNQDPSKLLESIIKRYIDEIKSKFSITHYYFIEKTFHFIFAGLLKPYSIKFEKKTKPNALATQTLIENFYLSGETQLLQILSQKGTVVLVPTHISHWDSVIVGFATRKLGLPPLSWGTGLNLFNSRSFRWLFSQLGTYKVDRRKKNIPYLQTQKDYACLTLINGCHTLFYPSGTRSRSGSVESDLKLGLLGTPLEAQLHNFIQDGTNAKKLFIVPIALNYHCVLEANQLIREYLCNKNSLPRDNCCATHLTPKQKMMFKESEIFVNIGMPLDVLGNLVDSEGMSYGSNGEKIDLYAALTTLIGTKQTVKVSNDWVKTLSHKLIASYHQINPVLSSHLVAFVTYEIIKNKEEDPFLMKQENRIIPYALFIDTLAKTYQPLLLLYNKGEIAFTPILLDGNLNDIAKDGLSKLGGYHAKQPLKVDKNGNILVQDMLMLVYYHNRLIGYGLEDKIK